MSAIVLRSDGVSLILPARCFSRMYAAMATLIVDAVHIGAVVAPVFHTAPVCRSRTIAPISPGRPCRYAVTRSNRASWSQLQPLAAQLDGDRAARAAGSGRSAVPLAAGASVPAASGWDAGRESPADRLAAAGIRPQPASVTTAVRRRTRQRRVRMTYRTLPGGCPSPSTAAFADLCRPRDVGEGTAMPADVPARTGGPVRLVAPIL